MKISMIEIPSSRLKQKPIEYFEFEVYYGDDPPENYRYDSEANAKTAIFVFEELGYTINILTDNLIY
jgi:hypothetical protein